MPRISHQYTDKFVKIPVKLDEGIISRKDVTAPSGGMIYDAIQRAAPLMKGDIVQLCGSDPDHIIVTDPLNTGRAHGILISSPQGSDSVTDDGSKPEASNMRIATMALFATGVIELKSSVKINAGSSLKTQYRNVVTVVNDVSVTSSSDNGGMIALRSSDSSGYVPIGVNALFKTV